MAKFSIVSEVSDLLSSASRILFITGAGISADSGLPTYRGTGGLYNGKTTEDGMRIEDALSARVFASRPDITWKYLEQIEGNCRGAKPNAAHLAITQLERLGKSVMVFTQNVDGLHRAAGNGNVIEIHGNLQELICTKCSYKETIQTLEARVLPPLCPECEGILRPKVVLFGESLPVGAVERMYDEIEAGLDAVITIGTSNTFPYIAQPIVWAIRNRIPTVEINPIQTSISDDVDYHLQMGAAEAMTKILAQLLKKT